jgi:hypothetical protein
MLASLNINTNLSATRLDGNSKPIPETLGPMGNRLVRARKEIFAAGYGPDTSNPTGIHQSYRLLEDWASGTRKDLINFNPPDKMSAWGSYPKKSAAADLDGDGKDEIVVALVNTSTNKIGLSRGNYTADSPYGAISWAQPTIIDYVQPREKSLADEVSFVTERYLTRVQLTAGDFDGDGKSELILVVANTVYILNSSLNVIKTIDTIPMTNPGNVDDNFVRVAVADFDADGKDEFVLLIGRYVNNTNAPYYIYDDMDTNFGVIYDGNVSTNNGSMKVGNVAVGNFSGGSLPDIAFYGERTYDRNLSLFVLKTSMNSGSQPLFNFMNLTGNESGVNGHHVNPLAAGDVDGDGVDDLFYNDRFWHLNVDTDTVEQVPGTQAIGVQDAFDVVMGDITGDGRDDLVVFHGWGQIRLYYWYGTQYKYETVDLRGGGNWSSGYETGCLPNVDNDGFVLEYAYHELQYTAPQVIAVLVSAPYVAGKSADGGGTSYGKSVGGSATSGQEGSFSVGVSVGVEFEVSFFGMGKTGTEVTAEVNKTSSWSFAETTEWQESLTYNTFQEDMVVYTAIPFDIYVYKVISAPEVGTSDNPTSAKLPNGVTEGGYTEISYPRKPQTLTATLPTYNSLVPEDKQVTVKHTPGNPGSYYTKGERNAFYGIHGNTKGMFPGIEPSVGEGAGTTTISRSSGQVTEKGFQEAVESSFSVEVKAGSAKLGASTAFGYGYSTSTSAETSTEVSGAVANIPGNTNRQQYGFDWGLMAFPKDGYLLVTYYTFNLGPGYPLP